MVAKNKLIAAISLMALLICTGAVSYHLVEGWTYTDSLYFTVVTLSTIGYGDLYPVTQAGKMFTIFFIIAGVGSFLLAIATIAEYVMLARMEKIDEGMKSLKDAVDKVNISKFSGDELVKHAKKHFENISMKKR
jgi:voltage-gated potassium channel